MCSQYHQMWYGFSEEKMSDKPLTEKLCETWLHKENIDNLSHPNGYLCNFVLRNKMRKEGHPSGRILVYFHSELSKVRIGI